MIHSFPLKTVKHLTKQQFLILGYVVKLGIIFQVLTREARALISIHFPVRASQLYWPGPVF